ncbi:MAG: hypothetical protein D6786_02655 [Gammaproteobacteria bacterium]|nr:MAG: hypothetical protein D6786_02655 [Gammaproteobacteria bacterium]
MASTTLTLLPGLRGRQWRIGDFSVVVSPRTEPPFPVQAFLLEEDTWRVLSAPVRLPPMEEHPVRVMTDLIGQRPQRPGTLLIRGRRWEAIVVDLEQEPICRQEWVRQASMRALAAAADRRLRTLALPLLGSRHGGLTPARSLQTLLEVLQETPGNGALKVWLQVPASAIGPLTARVAAAAASPS